jgi:hypothetical protein
MQNEEEGGGVGGGGERRRSCSFVCLFVFFLNKFS